MGRHSEMGTRAEAWLLAGAVLAALFVESRLTMFGVRPGLTVLCAYAVGLRRGPMHGIFGGAIIGAVADGAAGGMLGPSMLGTCTAGYLAAFANRGLFQWSPVLGAIWAAMATAVAGGLSFASLSIFSAEPTDLAEAVFIVGIQCVINAAGGALIRPGSGGSAS
jgi:rod shape-determining protein MreD